MVLFKTLSALVLCCASAVGATYYVAKTGSDANAGTFAEPFLTVGKGADVARAGDTVYVATGTYQENLILTTYSGSAGSPITIDGQNVATMGSFALSVTNFNVQNFAFSTNKSVFGGQIYMGGGAWRCVISNNVFNPLTNQGVTPIVKFNGPDAAPYGVAASQNLFVSNTFENAAAEMVLRVFGITMSFTETR